MRPNNLTRWIFKTKVTNECRVNNNGIIYKSIHVIKEKYFNATNLQCTKKATIRMHKHSADTPPKSGEICQKVLLETENAECVWTYLPIVHETGETEGTMTCDLQVSSQSRQIHLLTLNYPSVRPSVHLSVRPSTCMNETSTGRLYVKFDIEDPNKNREIPGWSQSSINRHFTRRPKCVIFFPATLKLHVTFTFELNLIRLLG